MEEIMVPLIKVKIKQLMFHSVQIEIKHLMVYSVQVEIKHLYLMIMIRLRVLNLTNNNLIFYHLIVTWDLKKFNSIKGLDQISIFLRIK